MDSPTQHPAPSRPSPDGTVPHVPTLEHGYEASSAGPPGNPANTPLAGITVVLVRPRNVLNIGAVARAMVDFGFADLRIVTDYPLPFHEARSAVDAASVLASAQLFPSLQEAIADTTLVYGTTALGARNLQHPVVVLRTAAETVRQHLTQVQSQPEINDQPNPETHPQPRAALLFGSEKTGLSNDELSLCHRLLTIPMHTAGVSMNLGQAVAVTLYEFVRHTDPPRALPEPALPATSADLDRFEALLRQALIASGYEDRHPGNLAEDNLRRLVRRLALPAADIPGWLGMLRQLLYALPTGKPSRE